MRCISVHLQEQGAATIVVWMHAQTVEAQLHGE